jgi:hypothetical protein
MLLQVGECVYLEWRSLSQPSHTYVAGSIALKN